MSLKQTPRLEVKWLDPEALEIVRALQQRNFVTYLVGGCVRDLLLGKHPKDYDIATNARPQEVKRAVPYCFIIGKRFRLVLAKRGEFQFEIATFRREATFEEKTAEPVEDGPVPSSDNLFGSPEEDAKRRDFTINALFYDPLKNKLIDYADGLKDLRDGIVRMIGDPDIRLVEDPIRILRGIRLSQMIRFALDTDLRRSMKTHAHTLENSALPRRREEFLKFLRLDDPALPFVMAYDLGVLKYTSPTLEELLSTPKQAENFLSHLHHISLNEKASPAELFAGLVHSYIRAAIEPDPHVDLNPRKLFEDPRLVKLMRDEMGLFKNEQILLLKAFEMQNLLLKRKEFERRGERRRRAVVSHPAFTMALQIAQKDIVLSPADVSFWRESYQSLPAEHHASRGSKGPPRRRRRPRRPPPHRHTHQ